MPWLITLVRRTLWLALIVAAGGALFTWLRERNAQPAPAPPEWPPLDSTGARPVADTTSTTAPAAPAEPADDAPSTEAAPAESAADAPSTTAAEAAPVDRSTEAEPAAASSVVNALVDAPDARGNGADSEAWVAPADDGTCPVSHPIKANDNSGIFHVPGGQFYERTRAERCYTTAEAAAADGYRQAKS